MEQHFKNLIGLSSTAPDCITNPEERYFIENSSSGLYLDQIDDLNLNMYEAARDCSEGNLFDLMAKAKSNALLALKEALFVGLTSNARQARVPYTGLIGSVSGRGTYPAVNGERLGITLTAKKPKSLVLKIKRIGLLLDSDAAVEVYVSGYPEPFPIVTAARTASYYSFPVDEPLEIQLADEYGYARPVEIYYTVNGFKPMQNTLSCGCGQKDVTLAEFFEDGSVINQSANGLLLDVSISCDSTQVVKLNHDQNPSVAIVLANALRYKTAEFLIEAMNASDTINRYTMLETQYLWGKRNHFRKEFQDRINWLVSPEGLNLGLDSCFVCKPVGGLRRVGIK